MEQIAFLVHQLSLIVAIALHLLIVHSVQMEVVEILAQAVHRHNIWTLLHQLAFHALLQSVTVKVVQTM